MARKYDLISELYNRTCKTVVSNPQNWQAFLASACRNYKLRYDEQLLVYAQRPDATAVLEIEQWNKIFGRWVNRGARGIAVFADENRSRQRLTHYFDISDTHESRYSRTVPIWDMRQEYEADVIETLESTFGEIENKSSLAEAIMGAARNAAEDNIPDYLQDLYYATDGSFLEEVDNDIVASIYKNVVANSVAYMMMSRLGVDTDGYFELDDFRDVTNFNTQETLNALGFATSDIAEMGLTEISKTITALNRQNRIIVGQDRNEYNKVENNDERSLDNERTDLHNGGRLQPSEPETSTTAGSDLGQIRSDEEKVSEGTSQSPLLQSPDEGRTDTALGGSGTESQQDGGNNPEADGTERGSDRTDESGGYDEMGSSDELPSQLGTGNRESGSDIRLEYYDRTHEDKSLPFFGRDEVINEILRTTPHLSASLEEIKDYYEHNPDNKDRTEYIKSIFNNDYTELTLEDGRTVGYKTFENVLHLWEGKYDSRTAQSFYDWAVIARHFEAMRLLGELSDSIKPLPSMDGQMTFILDGRAEEKKTSAFVFSQEIIDAVLANGSGFSEGKMRIYEQFEKSLSAKENADFLKNEYGWGGSYPVIIGAGIDESHDGKGITITKGIGKENPHITLSWSQVEKRIGELIRMDRYLNPKEKERYPQWLESQEERRAKIEEMKRNREILSNAPPEQERLNRLYDTFSGKYGLINSRANTSAFSQDSSFSLLSALEIIGEDGELERKADMFSKRTIKPHTPVTSVDTASEALAVSLGEKATIDMDYMMELSGKSENEIFEDLKGVIFLNPLYEYGNSYEPKYLMADEYLSGNVREKLKIAKNSAELYPEDYKVNVEALQKVQPKDLTASEISVRLGATWLPPDDVQEFIFHLLETPRYAQWNIKVHFSPFTSEWNIEGKSYDKGNVRAYNTYGTSRINAYKIIEETLNLKDVRIFDYIEDDEGKKKAVLNKKETAIAQSKQEMIKQEFQDWIWSDPERRERLCKSYNEKFNSVRPREYDGSHIIFNGMNPEIELREHQKNAVAHILYGGNTLLAHAVGAGKTFEMVAAAQESKRLGLCNKSLFVVPNHLTEQWAAEYLQLYPAANILVATKKDFETKNRKKFCGRIATGDYDAVIIGHSQFEKIPMSIERQRAILEQQLEEITGGIAELKRNRGENFSIKQLEKSKKSIRQKLDKLNDQTKKDDVVTFEELGVDRLFVDESHYYKNLYLYTKMRNVGGIAQTEAQKSSDLFMKCRYLDEITGGRGTVFATGTPISNSMVELYTIQRYLQYNTLVKNGLQHFDAWASTFGETITAVELTPEGTGYRAKTRFAKFYNLPELMAMFKEIADIKTADMLNLPVPEAKYHNIAVKPSEMQKEMVASLAERAEQVRGGGVDSSVDNMLKITNDGRKLALDQRMLNDMLPDFEGSKINACVDNIYRIWKENADKKSAQLVFCDLSTPKNDGTFSVYNDIRKKLIERGIPESEVKFIHEADTDMKKKELFQKTRKGEVRVLLGSTQKMGAGTNVQDKLIALHDVDCPWRPSDLEQRSGRIVRQGNENPKVDIYRYVTEQTFDAYLYQLVEGKQKFASQIMTSKSPVRSAEDIDETALSYAEIKMLATGNPYIKEKMDLDIQVQKLKMLKSNFLSEKYGLEDKVIKFYPQQIAYLKSRVEGLTKDVETAKLHPKPIDEQPLGMMVSGVSYSEKAEAGQAIINACKSMNSPNATPLGEYRGFQMELYFDTVQRNYVVKLKGETSRDVPLGDDSHGNIVRIDNGIERFEEALADTKNSLENTEKQFETAKQEIEKPFAKEEELRAKTARLDELNILLNMDKKENEIVGGEPDEGEAVGGRKEKSYER